MRVELPVGSYVIVKMRCDGKPWKECGRLIGREVNVTRMRFAATVAINLSFGWREKARARFSVYPENLFWGVM